MRTFGNKTRTDQEIQKDEVNFNDILSLNNFTMCHNEFNDPFITCCFINADTMYVNLYHNHSTMHYHFIFDLQHRAIIGKVSSMNLESKSNFPFKCFYNEEKDEVHSFYRQG